MLIRANPYAYVPVSAFLILFIAIALLGFLYDEFGYFTYYFAFSLILAYYLMITYLGWLKVDISGFTDHRAFRMKFIPAGEVKSVYYKQQRRWFSRPDRWFVVQGEGREIRFPYMYRNMGDFCRYVMANFPRDVWPTAEVDMKRRIEGS